MNPWPGIQHFNRYTKLDGPSCFTSGKALSLINICQTDRGNIASLETFSNESIIGHIFGNEGYGVCANAGTPTIGCEFTSDTEEIDHAQRSGWPATGFATSQSPEARQDCNRDLLLRDVPTEHRRGGISAALGMQKAIANQPALYCSRQAANSGVESLDLYLGAASQPSEPQLPNGYRHLGNAFEAISVLSRGDGLKTSECSQLESVRPNKFEEVL